MKYATRINSFLRTGLNVIEALREIGKIDGVEYVDINYPEHFEKFSVEQIGEALKENGLKLNAMNMRFRSQYINGIFNNPDEKVREEALALCLEADKVCSQLSGNQCIVWLATDGFDYSFQIDYLNAWNNLVNFFGKLCDSAENRISIEYKPYEERSFAMIDSWGSAAMLVKDTGKDNFGIVLDVCHMIMKKENPALAAQLLLQKGKLYGIHVNDGEGSVDDGLMVGSVHPFKILELFYYLKKYNFSDVIYFDTFPKRERAAEECILNLRICKRMEQILEEIGMEKIDEIVSKNDGEAAMRLMISIL